MVLHCCVCSIRTFLERNRLRESQKNSYALICLLTEVSLKYESVVLTSKLSMFVALLFSEVFSVMLQIVLGASMNCGTC